MGGNFVELCKVLVKSKWFLGLKASQDTSSAWNPLRPWAGEVRREAWN